MLLVFDYDFPQNIAHLCWNHGVKNSEVRHVVISKDSKSIDKVVDHRCLKE